MYISSPVELTCSCSSITAFSDSSEFQSPSLFSFRANSLFYLPIPTDSCRPAISSVLPRHRADSRSPSSRSLALYLSICLVSCPRPSRTSRLSQKRGSYDSRLASRSTGPPQNQSYLAHRTLTLLNSRTRRFVPSRLQCQ